MGCASLGPIAAPHRQPRREIRKALQIYGANLRFLDSAVNVGGGLSRGLHPVAVPARAVRADSPGTNRINGHRREQFRMRYRRL
jgi:hypothetical protein